MACAGARTPAPAVAAPTRMPILSDMTTAMTGADASPQDIEEIAKAGRTFKAAHTDSLRQLASSTKARRREPKFACPRWGEAGEELLKVLEAMDLGMLATQLSQVLSIVDRPGALSPEDARAFTTAMYADPKNALLNLSHGGKITCWAPADPGSLGRWMAGFSEHAAAAAAPTPGGVITSNLSEKVY